MENTHWQKQSRDKPLFSDILWAKPENRRQAGKLLIIGGNSHALNAPGAAFSAAIKAGIGTVRVLLPHAAQKTIGKLFPEAEFAPSTPSGGFSRESLGLFLENAGWADGILLAGDFGKNSETAILLESFLDKYRGTVVLTGDSIDYFIAKNSKSLDRPNTVVVANFGQLQKLASLNAPPTVFKHSMSLHHFVEAISQWSKDKQASFITMYENQFVAISNGGLSTTHSEKETKWETELPAYAAVWLIQQPTKPYETLTTAAFDYLS